MASAASAGVAIPPATKLTTGSFPSRATCWTSSRGALLSFAPAKGSAVRRPNTPPRPAPAPHAPPGADIRGHAFERHHRDGPGILSDAGVFGRDHVHDHATLEHLGETLLGRPGRRLAGHRSFT